VAGGDVVTRRANDSSAIRRAVGNPPVLYVTCRNSRMLRVEMGFELASAEPLRGRPDDTVYGLNPYRWPPSFCELTLRSDGTLAGRVLSDPPGSGDAAADHVPPFPCPNHAAGHVIDGGRLADEVANARGRREPPRVPVRRVWRRAAARSG